jgi:hypothetical protein
VPEGEGVGVPEGVPEGLSPADDGVPVVAVKLHCASIVDSEI